MVVVRLPARMESLAMRNASWLVFPILVLAGVAPVNADAPYEATIIAPIVEVRSGASAQYYATGRLQRGERVQVVGEAANNWLKITPPVDSFSWVEGKLVSHTGTSA